MRAREGKEGEEPSKWEQRVSRTEAKSPQFLKAEETCVQHGNEPLFSVFYSDAP